MNTLPPINRALYHGGCSFRHAGKALLAGWRCLPLRLIALTCLLASVVLLTGCASKPSGGLLGWVFGRKAAAVAKVENKVAALEDNLVDGAQVEVAKTGLALQAATPSRPVEVAQRTNANAAALLNQRKPLNAATLAEITELVGGLLSEETAKRDAAEAGQRQAEGRNGELSRELEAVRGELKELGKQRDAEAANNLALANELRWKTIVAYSGVALSTLLGLAAFAYKANLGNFRGATAELLGTLRKKDPATAEVATTVFDAALSKGEQNKVAQLLFNLSRTSGNAPA